MTNVLPPVLHDAAPVNPPGFGLYAAATVTDLSGPSRLLGGVSLRIYNGIARTGDWPADITAEPDLTKDPGRPDQWTEVFETVVGWSAVEAEPTEPVDELRARAEHGLILTESHHTEAAIVPRLLADAGPAAAVPGLAAALGQLEQALAAAGLPGVIHAPRRYAALAAQANLLVRGSGAHRTPLGNTWAFGSGYADGLGDTLIATSPVTVWRDPLVVNDTLDPDRGARYAVAERAVAVGYEHAVAAVTITTD